MDSAQYLEAAARIDQELHARMDELTRFLKLIEEAAGNRASVLPEGSFEKLMQIHRRTLPRPGLDVALPLLTGRRAAHALSIRQGSLNQQERDEVESHVLHTYNFLRQIPWTREISHVPELARHHHERINGKGYPAHIKGDEIPLPSRLMSIADVFDALAAADRPLQGFGQRGARAGDPGGNGEARQFG